MIILNKTMEKSDLLNPEVASMRKALKSYAGKLFLRGIPFAINGYLRWNYYVGWYKLWEYARGLAYTGIKKGMRVLDVGGAATLPVFYLAQKGCKVISADIDEKLVSHTEKISKKMKWELKGSTVNLCENDVPESWGKFDLAVSFCVVEHMDKKGQIKAMRRMADSLVPGGKMVITFDYGQEAPTQNPLSTPENVEELISASGLSPEGNRDFLDTKNRFKLGHAKKADYTFGSLFLKK